MKLLNYSAFIILFTLNGCETYPDRPSAGFCYHGSRPIAKELREEYEPNYPDRADGLPVLRPSLPGDHQCQECYDGEQIGLAIWKKKLEKWKEKH